MAEIKHNDMSGTPQKKQKTQPQTYVVDDATQDGIVSSSITDRMAQFEAQPEQTVQVAPVPQKKKLSETLEKLIFIGRIKQEIEIDGATFEISTLLNKEHDEIIKMMYSFTNPGDLFVIRVLTLANVIKSIDGVSLDDIEIDGEYESDFHRRIAIVDYLQLSVVETLYDAYEKLLGEEGETSDKSEEIKNS